MKKLFYFLVLGTLIVSPSAFVGCGPAGHLDSDTTPTDVPEDNADEGPNADAPEEG